MYTEQVKKKFPCPDGYIECPQGYHGPVIDRITKRPAKIIAWKDEYIMLDLNGWRWTERPIWYVKGIA